MDRLDLLAVQGTLKNLLQHYNSKASILWLSAFFIVKLSHPHMTTGKTIALTRRTFVGKAMSLLFNMLSGLVIAFLPKSKHLIISWQQSPSAVILEPKKIKSLTVAHFFLVLNGVPRSGCEQSPVVSRCDMVSRSLDVSGVFIHLATEGRLACCKSWQL